MNGEKMDCVNLKERFGKQYRVRYEESYYADHGERARGADTWLMILLCKYGHIFPHGGTTLAASVDGHTNVAGRMKRLSCCRVQQDGDDGELTVLFDVADFPKVAAVMRPRRRRRISQAERDRLRAMGFQHGQKLHSHVQPTAHTGVLVG